MLQLEKDLDQYAQATALYVNVTAENNTATAVQNSIENPAVCMNMSPFICKDIIKH